MAGPRWLFALPVFALLLFSAVDISAMDVTQAPIGYYNGSSGGRYAIGAIMEGTQPYRHNPVLTTVPDSWQSWHVKDAAAVLVDGTYYLYYAGSSDGLHYSIGLATSKSGLRFDRIAEPILTHGPTGTWDSVAVAFPTVYVDVDGWHMLFYGRNEAGVYAIGLATSPDGIAWTKYAGNPVFEGDEAWNVGGVIPADIVRDGDHWLLYYGGIGADGSWQGGVRAFTEWRRPFTKIAHEPILTAPYGPWKSVIPGAVRVVDGRWEMLATVFHCCLPEMREETRRAASEDGLTWTMPLTDVPALPIQRWASESAENVTWLQPRYSPYPQ